MTRAGSNTITMAHRAIKYHGHLICNPYDTSTKTALVIALFKIPEPLLRAALTRLFTSRLRLSETRNQLQVRLELPTCKSSRHGHRRPYKAAIYMTCNLSCAFHMLHIENVLFSHHPFQLSQRRIGKHHVTENRSYSPTIRTQRSPGAPHVTASCIRDSFSELV